MTAFDVGADAGYFTLLLAKAVGPSGEIVAFELPDPGNLVFLREHVARNGFSNVSIVAAAVSDRTGGGHFKCNRQMGRLSMSGETAVRTIRLDEFPGS